MRRRLQRVFRWLTALSPALAGRLALQLFLTPPRRKLEAVDAPVIARARRRHIDAGGHGVHLYEWGDAREAILLLHGWGSHAPRFGAFVDPLLAADFRVVAIDAPAHGESTGRQSSLEHFRHGLAGALADCAPVVGIVAHSLGAGATVWQLAEAPHPDVRSVVLVAMPNDVGYMLESFSRVLALRDDVKRELRAAFMRRFEVPPEQFSTHAIADRLGVPALLVHDRDDDVAPFAHSEALLARLARGELHATSGLSHSGPLRDAPTVATIVEFLSRHCRA
jgi:pimeloyl-ACP methyl ester carboxylesterase